MKKIIFTVLIVIIFTIGVYINKNNILYNIANFLYNKKDYENALNIYDKINKKTINFQKNYNKGNTFYRISQQNKNKEEEFIKKAINSYQEALKINNNDSETKENIDFLTKKLQKKQENKKVENEKNKNSNENEQKDKDSKSGNKSQENKKEETKNNNGETKKENVQKKYSLDKQTQEQIDNYQQQLKEIQKENVQNFQKKSPTNTRTDLFGNEIFFDNSILEGGEKKDW